MDELKKYLLSHSRELNLDEPSAQVWQNIQQEVGGTKKTNRVMLVTRWAAAACILVLAGIGGWFVMSDQKTKIVPIHTIAKAEKNTSPAPGQTQPEVVEKKKNPAPMVTTKAERVIKDKGAIINQPVSKETANALNELETSFTQVINLQRARVSSIPMYAETPAYFDDFKIQIKQMEKDEKVIKSDIVKRGMSDELLDQLINLYQLKLGILKQLQIEMNKTNNRFKQNRGPVDSIRTYFLNM